jgi:hypothetical protein
MTPEKLTRMQAEIRREFKALAKVYPGCFDAAGKPIVAELRLPTVRAAATIGEQK